MKNTAKSDLIVTAIIAVLWFAGGIFTTRCCNKTTNQAVAKDFLEAVVKTPPQIKEPETAKPTHKYSVAIFNESVIIELTSKVRGSSAMESPHELMCFGQPDKDVCMVKVHTKRGTFESIRIYIQYCNEFSKDTSIAKFNPDTGDWIVSYDRYQDIR